MEQLVEVNIAQQAMNQEMLEEQPQETVLLCSRCLTTAGDIAAHQSQVNPSSFIIKLTYGDDIEAYLQTFQRMAS